ncbi:hypothetical protein Agub_g2789, partial [Astrephomene gubernaculifera]
LLLVTFPVPWTATLLPIPDVWIAVLRRYRLHWVLRSIWAPATLQLSPYLQVRATLANLLPITLLMRHFYDGRWRPALVFSASCAVCGMLLSAVIDWRARRRFAALRGHA